MIYDIIWIFLRIVGIFGTLVDIIVMDGTSKHEMTGVLLWRI